MSYNPGVSRDFSFPEKHKKKGLTPSTIRFKKKAIIRIVKS